MIRTAVLTLRCIVLALFAATIISARPAMLLAHAGDGVQHGCGGSMTSHSASGHGHSGHHCSSTEGGTCCDDCVCACMIAASPNHSVVVLTATYTHPAAVASRFSEVVRERKPLAWRLPPPIGPPLFTRS